MKYRNLFIFCLAALGFVERVTAQSLEVYPGDITNNGVVNNIDFINMGLAYNYFGPARTIAPGGLAFEAQPAFPWVFQFPDGLNMAYADCNGDGYVNYYYDAFPLYTNYGLQRPDNVALDSFTAGIQGIDPALRFDQSAVPALIQGGQWLSVPIELGSSAIPINDLYGIAFSIFLDPGLVNLNQTSIDFAEQSWANPDNDRIYMFKKVAPNRIDVAWVRTDLNQKAGFGRIGKADIIIIVDVVGLQQQYPVIIDNIKMIDKFGNYADAVGDTLMLNVDPEALVISTIEGKTPDIKVSPNPIHDQFHIRAEVPILHLSIVNLLGQTMKTLNLNPQTQANISIVGLPPGLYSLRVETVDGITVQRIQIQ